MKREGITALAVLAIIAVSLATGALGMASPSTAQSAAQKRFGFGFIGVGSLIASGFTTEQFFDGMFLTPPYPSAVELTIGDNSGVGTAFATAAGGGDQLPYLLSLMQLASAYPNIQIVVHIDFNLSSSATWSVLTTQFFPSLYSSPYKSSIGAIGFNIEQTNVDTNCSGGSCTPDCTGGSCDTTLWQSSLAEMDSLVQAGGWQFNSYYPDGISAVPNTSQYDFWVSSQPWAPQLTAGTATDYTGINIGGNGNDPWPSPECDSSGNPHWTDQVFPQGYYPDPTYANSGPCTPLNGVSWPATLDNVLATEASMPTANRQWVIIYAGNNADAFCSATGCPSDYVYTTGATGVSDYFNWDNVAFRDAIWNDPNYRGNFLLGEGASTTTTTTASSTISSATTSTSSSTVSSSSSTSTSSTSRSSTVTSTSVTTTIGASNTFNVIASNYSVSLKPGSSQSIHLTVTFQSSPFPVVGFSSAQLPAGTTVRFSTEQTDEGYAGTADFSASASAPPGVYPAVIFTLAGGLNASVALELDIQSTSAPKFSLSVRSSPAGGGTTDPSPGNYSLDQGQTEVIAALPSSGWGLEDWVVNGNMAGNGSVIEVQMYGNTSVAAVFAPSIDSIPTSTVSFLGSGLTNVTIGIDGHRYLLPVSFSWEVGSEHNASTPAEVQINSVTRRVFLGWGGGQSSTDPTLTFQVNQNVVVSPLYSSEFLIPVQFTDCSGAVLNTQEALLDGSGGGTVSLGQLHSAWLQGGSAYTLADAVWNDSYFSGDQVANPTFVVNGPGAVSVALPVCSLDVSVSDVFGPISGAQVYLQYADGGLFSGRTLANGVASFAQVPEGPYSAHVYYMGESSSVEADSSASTYLRVGFLPILTILLAIALICGVLAASLVALMVRRRLKPKGGLVFFS